MHYLLLLSIPFLAMSAAAACAAEKPAPMRLWPGDAPGAMGKGDADVPTITVFKPAHPTGGAVVICPGGAYCGLSAHEAIPIAEWLNSFGVTGVLLKYRLGPRYHHPVELQDVSRAIRTVRANARAWGIDPNHIGVIGFSAGGHLAATVATHFTPGDPNSPDPVERVSSRPDTALLIYAVAAITGHAGSMENLLGKNPPAALVEDLCNDKKVTKDTPPTFLVHTNEDICVPAEMSLQFAEACRRAGVPVELHMFELGVHGIGLGEGDPASGTWPKLCELWLKRRGFLGKP